MKSKGQMHCSGGLVSKPSSHPGGREAECDVRFQRGPKERKRNSKSVPPLTAEGDLDVRDGKVPVGFVGKQVELASQVV